MIRSLKEKPVLLGAFYVFMGVFLFSAVNIIVKDTAKHYPIIQVLFIRFLVGMGPLLFLLRKKLSIKGLTSKKPALQVSCAVMICIGVGCLFFIHSIAPSGGCSSHFLLLNFIPDGVGFSSYWREGWDSAVDFCSYWVCWCRYCD